MSLKVRIELAGHQPVAAEAGIEFTLSPQVEATGYVPEPQPVRGDIDVGAFYFPG